MLVVVVVDDLRPSTISPAGELGPPELKAGDARFMETRILHPEGARARAHREQIICSRVLAHDAAQNSPTLGSQPDPISRRRSASNLPTVCQRFCWAGAAVMQPSGFREHTHTHIQSLGRTEFSSDFPPRRVLVEKRGRLATRSGGHYYYYYY